MKNRDLICIVLGMLMGAIIALFFDQGRVDAYKHAFERIKEQYRDCAMIGEPLTSADME